MASMVLVWPITARLDTKLVFNKKTELKEDGTANVVAYKSLFDSKILKMRDQNYSSQGLRECSKNFSLRFKCTKTCGDKAFVFKTDRRTCEAGKEITWTLVRPTECKCFDTANKSMNIVPAEKVCHDVVDPGDNGTEYLEQHAEKVMYEIDFEEEQSRSKAILSQDEEMEDVIGLEIISTQTQGNAYQRGTPSTLRARATSGTPKWRHKPMDSGELHGPFSPSANSRIEREIDILKKNIEEVKNTLNERKVLEALHLANSYISNSAALVVQHPELSPPTLYDQNRTKLSRLMATQVFGFNSKDEKDSQDIFEEMFNTSEAVKFGKEQRKPTKRKLIDELNASVEKEKKHKKHKKNKKHNKKDKKERNSSGSRSKSYSDCDQENIIVDV